jgi:hypothetical protein
LCYNHSTMTEYINPQAPAPDDPVTQAALRKQRWTMIAIAAAVLLLLGLLGLAVYALLQNSNTTANIRDIFIIFMAFESLIIGAALVVLIIQVAGLINLLQNEVKPILESTSETVNNLRGTTEFLSENLVEPVIKLNSYLAGLRKILGIFGTKK